MISDLRYEPLFDVAARHQQLQQHLDMFCRQRAFLCILDLDKSEKRPGACISQAAERSGIVTVARRIPLRREPEGASREFGFGPKLEARSSKRPRITGSKFYMYEYLDRRTFFSTSGYQARA